ncbi:MAG: NUDIX hydrolase [Angustibacter sp.]
MRRSRWRSPSGSADRDGDIQATGSRCTVQRDFDLGPRVAEHAIAFVKAGATVPDGYVQPRRAATVVLLRDPPADPLAVDSLAADPLACADGPVDLGGRDGGLPPGPEVFLMRRRASMAFAPGMHVFPGGSVDPRDQDDGDRDQAGTGHWAGPPPARWAERLGTEPWLAAALVRAAIRELFEECGVLLAGRDPDDIVTPQSPQEWARQRTALASGALSLTELLDLQGLVLRSDLLVPWSRWCTPRFEPRRYDTWFFAAALPPGQRASAQTGTSASDRQAGGQHDGGQLHGGQQHGGQHEGEAESAVWLPAAHAARAAAAGTTAMMPPTLVTVEEIAAAADVATALASMRVVRRVEPWLVRSASRISVRVDVDGRGGGEPGPASGLELQL